MFVAFCRNGELYINQSLNKSKDFQTVDGAFGISVNKVNI